MQYKKATRQSTGTRRTLFACVAGLLAAAWLPARAQDAAPGSAPAAKIAAPSPATSCDIASFSRQANGQSFWSATGQMTVPNLTTGQMNCLLDQFAMNNFLYLVGNDSGGKPRFMSYAPWYALFTASGTPTWPGQYSPLSTVELKRFKNQTQAGDGYVLKDLNNQVTSYDIRVNQTFFNYVANNSLYKQSAFNAALAAFNTNSYTGGIYFPPVSRTDTSEGAIELKTAWRYFGPMQKKRVSQKITIDVNPCPEDLMHCEKDGKGDYWGLVGFHLVQKTVDQPGFVWATFEHVANAPDCAMGGYAPISQNPISPATGQPMNVNSRLLNGIGAKSGWSYFDYAGYKSGGGDGRTCVYPTKQQPKAQCLGYPKNAQQAWIPVNVCRTLSLPVPTATACANSIVDGTNRIATSCLNDSVKRNFASTGLAGKWMNYRLVAMEWLASGATGFGAFTPACLTYDETGPASSACPGYKQPAADAAAAPAPGGEVGDGPGGPPNYGRVGSSINTSTAPTPANTTMETWMQYNVFLNKNASTADCFACHQPATASFGQGDFSHLFARIRQP